MKSVDKSTSTLQVIWCDGIVTSARAFETVGFDKSG